MPRKGTRKKGLDPLQNYRNQKEREREERFHANAEKEDGYDWRKRPSKPESRNKKLVRKLGTTGQIISNSATTGDERTKYRTRNGVTWRTVKTEKELQAEAEAEAEREALRKKRSHAHRNDKGRPIIARYVIKLNVVGYPKPYYYCGDELGWGTYECAVQYLGEKKTLQYARMLIKNMGLEDKTERFDSVEVVKIPKDLNKEWLFAENIDKKTGNKYEEEEYETHEEYVKHKKRQNESRADDSCEDCLCNTCGRRNPFGGNPCSRCIMCKQQGKKENWRDECENYSQTRGHARLL